MSYKEFARKSLPKAYQKGNTREFRVGDLIRHKYQDEILYAVITQLITRGGETRVYGRYQPTIREAVNDESSFIRNGNAKYCRLVEGYNVF